MSKGLPAMLVILVFLVSLVSGALQPAHIKDSITNSTLESFKPIQRIVQKRPDIYVHTVPLVILFNNLRVALINFFLGVTFIVPLTVLAYNGFIIGALIAQGDIVGNAILLLPHGIIELTAIIYSAFLGVCIGIESLKKLLKKEGRLREALDYGIRKVPFIILLLAVAALVETFITPFIYIAYLALTGQQPPTELLPYP